jgi:hypothetical protein
LPSSMTSPGRHKGGSHCIFVRGDGRTPPVPARRPITPVYIKLFLALVDGVSEGLGKKAARA